MAREHGSRIVWDSHVAWQLDQLIPTEFGSGQLCVPSSDGVRGGVHGVDPPHESMRDTRGEILDEDVMVSNSGESNIIFE